MSDLADKNLERLRKIKSDLISEVFDVDEKHGAQNPFEEFEKFEFALRKATQDLEEAKKQGFKK